ncbi:MAG: UDP-3-O-(3-hydroxymyristoyl)glucosamine N-acyltransferase [Denitrovibrio sp.]|nr:MAG: UDP-3-O-(3-hydroxymyristoyl)glucosamine N-acyltransferase [Denitrovibrio sp.]
MKASELVEMLGAELVGADCEIMHISPLNNITTGGLVPLLERKIDPDVYTSDAAAFLVKAGADVSSGGTFIVAEDAELALIAAINALYPPKKKPSGVHTQSSVADSAVLGENVSIGALACVGENTHVGDGTQILPGAIIGDNVKIGSECIIYANASIYDNCVLGDRVIIHSGSVIGADGFGYYQKMGQNVKIPHVGAVVLANDVEIGANTCIDKGKFSDTIIGEGTKIDNQVQVAHNVVIGKNCILVGQCAIAGSSELGDYVMMGARAGVVDHVKVCSKTMIAGGCGVMSDIEKPGIYGGLPHTTRKGWMREVALIRDLPNIVKRITELEKNNA